MSESSSPQITGGQITGTPDRPNFKRRPLALVIALLAYASVVGVMIVWAIKLRHGK